MIEIGRVCYKLSGREANKVCVVISLIDDNFVMIDGDVRRKNCNLNHLEPLDQVLKIAKNDSTEKIRTALEKAGFKLAKKGTKRDKKARPRKHKKLVSKKKPKTTKPKKEEKKQ